MHSIKSYTTRKINEYKNTIGTIWHPEFYDRMIRNQEHLNNTINYIKKNAMMVQTNYIYIRQEPIPESKETDKEEEQK